MVGRSNEISREICRAQVVDSAIVIIGSGDRSGRKGPGRVDLMSWLITERTNDIGQTE